MEASTEVVVRKSTDVAMLGELEEILLGRTEVPAQVIEDPLEISREIMAQLLAAESDAELENIGAATGWRELEGVPVEIHSFRWRPSDYQEGAPVFFVVDATRLDTASRVVLTTGAANVLAQLVNMARRGTLVGAIRMIQSSERTTAAGYKTLSLVTPPGVEAPKADAPAPSK